MKTIILSVILIFTSLAHADINTAFLVVRADIENELAKIDTRDNLEESLIALHTALYKLSKHKEEVFKPALQARIDGIPLNGLTLTRIHSYLKIHLTILERGLALTDSAEEDKDSLIDEKAYSLMSLSLLFHFDEYLKDDRIRFLLSRKDESYDLKAKALKKAYAKITNRKVERKIKKMIKNDQLDEATVAAHEAYKKTWKKARKAFRGDFWKRFTTFVVHHISGGVGNTAGSVKFRKGTMWEDSALQTEIEAMLKPMDIITEKTPFILTDRLIPGHFGHNAIWLGTPAELLEMGLWESDFIKPFQNDILQGYNIIETTRAGTNLKKLSDWMNIDEIAVIRRESKMTKAQISEFYAILMAQYGKTYDFNFDVETTDRLVCSELLYQSYGDVVWPTEAYLGRYTISPDNVASIIVQKKTPFKLIFSMERNEELKETFKDTIALAADLGFTHNGVDEQGENILEQETLTCMDRVSAEGEKLKTCVKTWLRPVFGGKTIRRLEY